MSDRIIELLGRAAVRRGRTFVYWLGTSYLMFGRLP
jgi:hypothetical protein